MELLTALSLGFLGSLHCAGMCGPISLLVNRQSGSRKSSQFIRNGIYQFGRLTSYAGFGLIFGLIGSGVAIAGFQTALSLFLGGSLLVVALFSLNMEAKLTSLPFLSRAYKALQTSLGLYLSKGNLSSFYMIGILNGLLPCGLVYLALASALTMETVEDGILYMLFFGLGTIPMMFSIGSLQLVLSPNLKKVFRTILPLITALVGTWLIYRALATDLPSGIELFISGKYIPMCR